MTEDNRFIYPVRLYTSQASGAEDFLLEGKADKQTFKMGENMSGIIDNPFRSGAPFVQLVTVAEDTETRNQLFVKVARQVSDAFEEFSWLAGQDDGSFVFEERESVRIPDPNIGGIQKKGRNEILVALLLLEA